jgi:hypothetical protein
MALEVLDIPEAGYQLSQEREGAASAKMDVINHYYSFNLKSFQMRAAFQKG